jgi:hypothetical protein
MNQAWKLVLAYSASNTLASTYLIAASNSTFSSLPNSTQLNSTQHKPLIRLPLNVLQYPQIRPHAPQKEQRLPHRPGHVAHQLPALHLRQQRMPRYPLGLLAPLRLRLLDDVYTLLAVFAYVGEDVSDLVALVLRTGWAVAPGCRRLRAVDIEKVRVPGDREAEAG